MEYFPNYWQLVKITTPEGNILYKVFATWTGGYTTGESWKFNSGITEVTHDGDYVNFKGYSGSVYKCINKDHCYRTTAYTYGVLESMIKKADLVGAKIEVLPYNERFEGLI